MSSESYPSIDDILEINDLVKEYSFSLSGDSEIEEDKMNDSSKSFHFDSNLYLDLNKTRILLNEYFIDVVKGCRNQLRQLGVLLGNLKMASELKYKLIVGFRSSDYEKSGEYSNLGHKCMIKMRDALVSKGMIDVEKGHFNKDTKKGYRTRIIIRESLLNILKTVDSSEVRKGLIKDEDLVLLKDKDSEKSKVKFRVDISESSEYGDNKEYIKHSQQKLRRYNKFIYGCDFMYPSRDEVSLKSVHGSMFQLYRIYSNGSFQQGGRLYGGFHQTLSERQRSSMTINGNAVCELDYKACMLRMMYHAKGYDYPSDKDPYTDILDAVSISEWQRASRISLYRELLKPIIITITNCKSVNGFKKSLIKVNKAIKRVEREAGEPVYNLVDDFSEQVVKGILSVHNKIEDYFFKKSALYFQKYDSDIALNVVTKLADRGIPILPIHDSFVVEEQYKELLRKTMINEYYQLLKFYPVIH